MPARRLPAILRALRARFERRRPVRAGSLIVTLYGDAIAPRGGALWLGSLNTLVAPFGIEPGLVRTAMSRLVAEGWFERSRVGKSSYYRLTTRGSTEFATAAERIYGTGQPAWDRRFHLYVLNAAEGARRTEQRVSLAAHGFGQLATNVMVSPYTRSVPGLDDVVMLTATSDAPPDGLRQIAATSWRLARIEDAYRGLLDDIGQAAGEPTPDALSDEHAFEIRLLLVHEWRRIVLRDPFLPAELLPDDWPGSAARAICARLYRATYASGERWLDVHARNQSGSLPPAKPGARRRFTSD